VLGNVSVPAVSPDRAPGDARDAEGYAPIGGDGVIGDGRGTALVASDALIKAAAVLREFGHAGEE
jgi:hypothetical protein